ncbi:MAG TPA: hypothetical protein VES42_25905 [Pilimelia sp.]|nr:hypothetical protein [Pilimelia sp.]
MKTTTAPPASDLVDQADRPGRVGYAAAGWAAAYGTLALGWTITGQGFPFGRGDPDNAASLLRQLAPEVGAPALAGLLLTAAVAALAMAGRHAAWLRGAPRALLLIYGYAVAALLLVVVPDVSLLMLAGYAPMLIIGAPFGWPPVDYAEVFTWSIGNKAFAVLGGLLLARATLAWQRRTGGACLACGRGPGAAGWTSAAAAARWGRWAVGVAAVIPTLYAVSRFAWLAGIPLGITDEMLRDMQDTGLVWGGAGLGAFGLVGAVLTLGLVQRWGEVFPRWLVGLAGRPVPVRLAVIPASLVAVLVTAGGLAVYSAPSGFADIDAHGVAMLPMLLWPLWGVALALAAWAYHLRRRGACGRCGQTA